MPDRMQVTCRECGMRCSVSDESVRDGCPPRPCTLCGAELPLLGASVPEPREPLDTLRLDASSLATLVRLGETASTGPREGPRTPQASIPFDVSRGGPDPLETPRPPQLSIPFELVRPAPAVRPSARAVSLPHRAVTGPSDWEKNYVARVRGKRRSWPRILLVAAVAAVLALEIAIISGRVDPWKALRKGTERLRTWHEGARGHSL